MPQDKQTFEIEIDLYPLVSVMNTAYKYIDEAYVFLRYNKAGDKIIVEIDEKDEGAISLVTIEKEFKNELLDQALRNRIFEGTGETRDMIVSVALSTDQQSNAPGARPVIPEDDESLREIRDLLKEIDEEDEEVDDPRKIAMQWEEAEKERSK